MANESVNNGAGTRGKVMLVDDDKFLLDMYSMKFVQQGFSVMSCLSAKDALEKLRGGEDPDIVLFDITMPEMDGFALLRAMTEEKLAQKALRVALTNQSSDAEKMKAKQLGASEYIVKATLIPSEVVNMVEKMLGKEDAHS